MAIAADAPDGIRLRAHHLLCIPGFQGIGYTTDFIHNLYRVKRMVEEQPGLAIEVVDGCDDICRACPNMRDGTCYRGDEKPNGTVREIDRRVLERLGVRPGDRLRSAELYARIGEKIRPDDIGEICNGCEWLRLGFCRHGLAGLAVTGGRAARGRR